ncbi:MAG TPA: hypothetical protein VGE23_02810 [Candidatus Paceibacterota bacterium]
MDRNIVIGIVVAIALAVLGWWYWAMMMPENAVPLIPEAGTEAEQPEAVAVSEAALAGTWKSTQDARFVRVFGADGTVIDRYEGDDSATVTGSWSIVADPAREQPDLPAIENATVIKVQFPEEVMYFAVTELSATNLSMIYLSGNGVLTFTRVP